MCGVLPPVTLLCRVEGTRGAVGLERGLLLNVEHPPRRAGAPEGDERPPSIDWVGYVSQSTPESAGGVPPDWFRVNPSRRTCPLHWVLLRARPTRKGSSLPITGSRLLENN